MILDRVLMVAAFRFRSVLRARAGGGDDTVRGIQETLLFQEPRYAGTRKVEPAEDETCASILPYLKNAMVEGKS